MKKIYALVAGLLLNVNTAFADQGVETGKIITILVHHATPVAGVESQRIAFTLDGTKTGGLCESNAKEEWLIYLDSEAGKAQYSTVLAAYMSDKTISVYGNLTAECYGGGEVVRNIRLTK
ncbi:hypothetical protein [Microbulbifer spongiae]|uniref:Uncharacterized protein n=1 Tax=Microbulbifer spongiae TaxID=2944933 RepID=A0ABY9EC87_9GAMM|nr:hypothetical protein [Microbulbifer sp. MI-G]WKD49099.1 hypothetical protein M8T91_14530 [Microbulbifer sp. MI-G]